MESSKRSYRGLKICGIVATTFLVITSVALVTLYFVVLRPKDPIFISHPVTLEEIRMAILPVAVLNVTLGVVTTIDNPNYESFKYEESTAYVSYRGNVVGEAPIDADEIPARGKHNVTTSVTIFGDKLLGDDNFKSELQSGSINFTSASTLQGQVTILKVFKAKATGLSTCNITILVQEQNAESVCKSKVRL